MARLLTLLTVTLLGVITATSSGAQDQTIENALPLVGARVRVLSPRLGEGWHIGMFNRLRVEPACYRVLLFAPTGSRRISATLSVRDFARLQVSTIYDGQTRSYPFEPSENLLSKEKWRDISLEALNEAERNCRVGTESSPGGDSSRSQPNSALLTDANLPPDQLIPRANSLKA